MLKKEDLTRAVEVFAAGLTAYRAARGLGPIESADGTAGARSRRPDFFTPAV